MTAFKRRDKTSTRPLLRAVSAYRERAAVLIIIGRSAVVLSRRVCYMRGNVLS